MSSLLNKPILIKAKQANTQKVKSFGMPARVTLIRSQMRKINSKQKFQNSKLALFHLG